MTFSPAKPSLGNVVCDACFKEGDRSTHLKCATCPDFDLCSDCHANSRHGHHGFYKFNKDAIHKPTLIPLLSSPAKRPFLTIERRCKGKDVPAWEVFRNGNKMADLHGKDILRLGSIKKGDKVMQRVTGWDQFNRLIVQKVPPGRDLVVRLKHVELGWVTAFNYQGNRPAIETSNSGNADIQRGFIYWQGKVPEGVTRGGSIDLREKVSGVIRGENRADSKPLAEIGRQTGASSKPSAGLAVPHIIMSHTNTTANSEPLILTPAPPQYNYDDDGYGYDC